MAAKLFKRTLREQAEIALRDMIMSHRFTPGKRINVERLTSELGVSRTPVWQALKVLQDEGLVEHVPNRGILMSHMTLEMAHDLYTVRGRLESLAGRLAAEKIPKTELNRLKSILKEQKSFVQARDLVKYSQSDFDFHAIIYSSGGNWMLTELLENIKRRSRPFVCDITSILSELYEDHIEVVDALQEKNPNRAEDVMRAHNERMRRHIAANLRTG